MRLIDKIKGSRRHSNAQSSPNKCKRIRTWLYDAANRKFGPEANWVQSHIAGCPKCRRRLAAVGRVTLALSAMKAQPHRTDLLMRANAQAIGVLKHNLRRAQKARKLETVLPRPGLFERLGKYGHSVANVAACFVILLLMKVGVFSSVDKFIQLLGRVPYQAGPHMIPVPPIRVNAGTMKQDAGVKGRIVRVTGTGEIGRTRKTITAIYLTELNVTE